MRLNRSKNQGAAIRRSIQDHVPADQQVSLRARFQIAGNLFFRV